MKSVRAKKQVAAAKKHPRRRSVAPPHFFLLPQSSLGGTSNHAQCTVAKEVLDLILEAVESIDFVNAAIKTEIHVEPDGFHVRLDIFDRETGDPGVLDLRWDLPPFFASREQALDWIYARVREAWVHELNEALFVDGTRRRDLHNARGQTITPPEETILSNLSCLFGIL